MIGLHVRVHHGLFCQIMKYLLGLIIVKLYFIIYPCMQNYMVKLQSKLLKHN